MPIRHFNGFAVDVPRGWVVDEASECLAFFAESDGIGVVQISVHHTSSGRIQESDINDLNPFDLIAPLQPVRFPYIRGLASSGVQGGSLFHYWFLYTDSELFLVTYNCHQKNNGKELPVVLTMLSTFTPDSLAAAG